MAVLEDKGPANVISFLLGTLSAWDLLIAAQATDATLNDGQHCEAWFFTGMKHLAAGDKEKAIECPDKCVARNATAYVEHTMAKAELERLRAAKRDELGPPVFAALRETLWAIERRRR